jgi:hypothetical protein
VQDGLRGFRTVARALREAGLRSVDEAIYPGARRELPNEINREEITCARITWQDAALNSHVAATPALV